VANEQDLSKKIGLTRGKAVLIGVLAVTLVSVIYLQFAPAGAEDAVEEFAVVEETPGPPPAPTPSQPESTTAAEETQTATAVPAPTAEESVKEPPASQSLDAERWKAPDVDQIVQYDPFALPSAFPQPLRGIDGQMLTSEGIVAADAATRASALADAVAKLHTELESLRQRGVSVIVKQHDKYVAMIGDRTVHVGDEINGFTVTAIEPDGVRVEKKINE
jgi:hypothetical protein